MPAAYDVNASLLQDHETEVRAATIKDIASFVDLVGPAAFASEVMPYVLALMQDVNLVRVICSVEGAPLTGCDLCAGCLDDIFFVWLAPNSDPHVRGLVGCVEM